MKRNSLSPRISIIVGIFTFICFGGLSIHFLTKDSSDSRQPLFEIDGIIKGVKIEGIGSKQDLLIQLEGNDLWYRSPMSYPTKFTYGSSTKDRLESGSKVTLGIEELEHREEHKKHRLKGYYWREFVQMYSSEVSHLTYEDHLTWDKNNDKLGRILVSFLALGGLYLLIQGAYKLSKQNNQ